MLDLLEDEHGYEVEDVAHHGDRVEAMAYEDGQLMDFTRKLDKILRRGDTPKAVLLSGGGNDVTGETLGFLLNHAKAYRPGLNEHILKGTIDERLEHAYLSIISAVRAVVMFRLGRQIPILVHGYDYPVPDGRGLLGGFGFLPGPWLQPGLHARGYADPTGHQAILTQLIDRFNEMLQRLTTRFPDGDVHYVDLRGVLSNAPEVYKEWWANELHPTKKGFLAIAEKIADAIEAAAA